MPDHAPLTREQRVAIVKAAEAVALTGNLVMLTPEQVFGYEAAVAEAEKRYAAAYAQIVDHILAPHEREVTEVERNRRNPPPELMGRRVGGKGEDDE